MFTIQGKTGGNTPSWNSISENLKYDRLEPRSCGHSKIKWLVDVVLDTAVQFHKIGSN